MTQPIHRDIWMQCMEAGFAGAPIEEMGERILEEERQAAAAALEEQTREQADALREIVEHAAQAGQRSNDTAQSFPFLEAHRQKVETIQGTINDTRKHTDEIRTELLPPLKAQLTKEGELKKRLDGELTILNAQITRETRLMMQCGAYLSDLGERGSHYVARERYRQLNGREYPEGLVQRGSAKDRLLQGHSTPFGVFYDGALARDRQAPASK